MKVESFSSLIRPLVTIMVGAVFCVGFLTGRVNTDAFTNIVVLVFTFWFTQRQQEKADAGAGK